MASPTTQKTPRGNWDGPVVVKWIKIPEQASGNPDGRRVFFRGDQDNGDGTLTPLYKYFDLTDGTPGNWGWVGLLAKSQRTGSDIYFSAGSTGPETYASGDSYGSPGPGPIAHEHPSCSNIRETA